MMLTTMASAHLYVCIYLNIMYSLSLLCRCLRRSVFR